MFELSKLIQVSQHVDEHAAVRFTFQEIIQSELNVIGWFEYIDHLTDNVLEIVVVVVLHCGESLTLVIVKRLQLIASDDAIIVKVHYVKPIFDALLCCFVLNSQDEPNKVSKTHFLRLDKLLHTLREYPLHNLLRQSVPCVFRQLLLREQEIMITVQLEELHVNHIEVFIAEEVAVVIDRWVCLRIKNALQDPAVLKLST